MKFTNIQTGTAQNLLMVSYSVFDASYTKAMSATSADVVKQLLRDANEYVARRHFTISVLQPTQYSLNQP